MRIRAFLTIILIIWLPAASTIATTVSEKVQKPVKTAIDLYRKTQQEQSDWREEKEALQAKYESILKKKEELTRQEEALTRQNGESRRRINDKKEKIAHMRQITDRMEPFLQTLVDRIETMVAADAPFLKTERGRRIEKIKELLKDPQVTVSEKFRKITEALFVEAEYGQTIEVYQETLSLGDGDRLVNILRLGRISLFYQSLDQRSCGYYNVARKNWHPLAATYNPVIKEAIEMGAKRRPIELLPLPVGRIATH